MQLAFALTERVSVAEGTWVKMEVDPLPGMRSPYRGAAR
jgi:hypothetical protein